MNDIGGVRRVEGSHSVVEEMLPLTAQQADRLNQLRAREESGLAVPVEHCPAALLTLRGELDRSALASAVTGLLERQSALRTRFGSGGQFVTPDGPGLAVLEPEGTTPAQRAASLSALLEQRCRHEFDPTGPMADFTLIPVAADEAGLLIRADQFVADLWSLTLIAGDLGRAYGQALGVTGPPEPLPLDYPQAVRAEAEWLAGPAGLAARDRCARLAKDIEPLPLPGGSGPAGAYGTRHWRMSGAAFAGLTAACRAHRTTVVTAVLGALGAAIAGRLRREAVSVLVVFTGRDQRAHQPLVMWRSTMLPVRVAGLRGRGFADSLSAVQRASFLAMENQRVPWPVIMGDHGLGHQPDGRQPVEVSLQYVPKALGDSRISEGFPGLEVRTRLGTACPTGAAIDVLVAEQEDGIAARVLFRQDLLDIEFVDAVVADVSRLLAELQTPPRRA